MDTRNLSCHYLPCLFLTLLLLAGICSDAAGQEPVISSDTRYVIDEMPDGEPFIRPPVRLAFFSDGSYVMQLNRTPELMLYSRNGEYIRSLGGRGRGPFEFLELSWFFINSGDTLVAFDNHQIKITEFSREEGLDETTSPIRQRPRINGIYEKTDGNYLAGVRRYDLDHPENNEPLFYEMKRDYTFSGSGLVPPSQLHDEGPESISQFLLRSRAGHAVLTPNDDLVIAPALYTGLFRVFRTRNGYRMPDTIRTAEYHPPYREYNGPTPDSFAGFSEKLLSMSSGSDRSVLYYRFNRSSGLFTLNTGEILHLVQGWDADQERVRLWAELLNEDATRFLGRTEITTLGDIEIEEHVTEGEVNSLITLGFLHLDRANNLYVTSTRENHEYELHVIKLDVEHP